jgi:hypothetical protein
MLGAGTWLSVDERNTEHISAPSKRLNVVQTKLFNLLDRVSRVRRKAKSPKGCPTTAQFMLKGDAPAHSAAEGTDSSIR